MGAPGRFRGEAWARLDLNGGSAESGARTVIPWRLKRQSPRGEGPARTQARCSVVRSSDSWE